MDSDILKYSNAVEAIKEAVLRAQYSAAKATNAQQLQLYYVIGGYLNHLGKEQDWGSGALDTIGKQLQKELLGLRGFSGRNLRLMRTFYQEWSQVFPEESNLELMNSKTPDGKANLISNLQVPKLSQYARRVF